MMASPHRALATRKPLLVGGGLIGLATVLCYLPALRAGFVWDDDSMLTNNPFVKLPAGLYYIWASTALPDFFPLTSTSFWFEWRLWGANPFGYHLTNVLLHAAGAIVLWRVLAALRMPGAWLAALVFAVHPLNVQSVAWIAERKNTLCMVFFLLSVLWYLRFAAEESELPKHRNTGSSLSAPRSPLSAGKWYWLSLLAFLCALLSKTAVVMLPVVLLLYHWWRRVGGGNSEHRIANREHRTSNIEQRTVSSEQRTVSSEQRTANSEQRIANREQRTANSEHPPAERGRVGLRNTEHRAVSSVPGSGFRIPGSASLPLLLRLAPFFALSLVLGLVTVWFQTHRAIGGDAIRSADFPTRLAGAGQAVGFYFQKLLWPLDLCFVYPEWKTEPGSPTAWLPLLGLLAVFGLGGLFRRGWGRHLLFASGWFVLLLLPVLGFVDIYFHRYAPVADHWAYFAGIGIIVGVVSTGAHLFQRHKRKGVVWLLPATAVAAVAWMGTATWRQAGVYHDLGTLWTDTLGKNPNCWLAHNSLGSLLANAGYLDDARVHYERALAIKPDAPEVLNNVASVRLDQGRPDEAIVLLRRVLDVSPRSAMAHYNLGNAYDQQGDADTAEKHYRRALELDPAHAEAHSNLGCLLYATGRKSEAIDAFAHAISLRPDYAEALNNLGAIFLEQGRFQQAESLLLEAVRHKPDYSDAWFNLGNAVLPQGRTREAVVAYRRVLALSPRHALAHCRLGSALWHDGNPSDALAELDRALKLQPDLAEAHHQTGIILASGQKPALAVSHLRRAVELQPDWPEALAGLAFTLATAASEKDRDGAEALRVAGRAVELTRRTNFIALDALAAALAETATFEEATRTAGLAAELATTAGDTNRAEQIHLRQKLYESGKPHRQ